MAEKIAETNMGKCADLCCCARASVMGIRISHPRIARRKSQDHSDHGSCTPIFNHQRKEVRQMLFRPQQSGQGLVEYALILVLVAVVVIVILALLGPAIGNVFSNIVRNV
jgi:pilus assembly protein Flp/PilA